jgi:betaine-aldehyde dehydrogenase
MYIDGDWVDSQSRQTREIINPYNQEVIAVVQEGNETDAQMAISAARKAFDEGPWQSISAAERGHLLFQIAEKIIEYKEDLSKIETLNTGKTITESEADMDDIAAVFHFFAGLADKDEGHVTDSPIPDSKSRIVREPVGVCGQITPWNYPLLQAAWKVAPALAAGNTIVLKPSEITPLTTIKLAEIIDEVGFPPGVFNVVLGPGESVGAELAISHDVDLISFTGGGTTGRKIMQAAAGNFKKISLELGGKNPNIIFADADLDVAIDYAMNAAFFHAGQVCSAGSRLLVHESIHDHFVAALVEKAQHVSLGNGFDKDTEMGPVISSEHMEKIENYIALGVKEGANLAVGGKRSPLAELTNGNFFEPTIFTNCDTSMRIVQEEVFGPVVTVESFTTEEEVIQLANDSVYGLAGAVWTQDLNVAERVVKKLRMGTTWINDYHPYIPQAPWGGYKQSGIGRELGAAGLEEYTELKHIYQNSNPKPLHWFK